MFCDSPHMHRHLESAYAFQMPYSDCTRGPYNPLIPTPCDGICRKTNVKEKQKSFKQIFEIWSCTVSVKLVSSDITPPQFQWIVMFGTCSQAAWVWTTLATKGPAPTCEGHRWTMAFVGVPDLTTDPTVRMKSRILMRESDRPNKNQWNIYIHVYARIHGCFDKTPAAATTPLSLATDGV